MSRFSFPAYLLSAAVAYLAAVTVSDNTARAQNSEAAKIVTADGVRLAATFYPSEKKNAPTVIMLHPIGDGKSSKSQDWKNLAEALQKANYSVITFDFRGHGESTSIKDQKLFWSQKANVNNVKSKTKDEIDVKDFSKNAAAYYPILVNDIAAVRAFLDARNDSEKDCNTSSIIVIGAENGATLGALWMNAEWHRFKYTPPPMFTLLHPKFVDAKAEGKDIIGAVFLTVQPSAGRTMSVSSLLRLACKENATAAAFFYGGDDTKGRDLSTSLEKNLKPKGSKNHDFIGAVKLKTNLSGMKLLQKGLGTEKAIVDYLDSVVAERKEKRVDRDFSTNYYVWKEPGTGKLIPAKQKKGNENLNFDDYYRFIGQ